MAAAAGQALSPDALNSLLSSTVNAVGSLSHSFATTFAAVVGRLLRWLQSLTAVVSPAKAAEIIFTYKQFTQTCACFVVSDPERDVLPQVGHEQGLHVCVLGQADGASAVAVHRSATRSRAGDPRGTDD
jgi:hypothetical protein